MNEELYKEAFLNPRLIQGFKNSFVGATRLADDAAQEGKAFVNATGAHPTGGTVKMFTPEEIAAHRRQMDVSDGDGMFLGGAKWLTKKIGDTATQVIKKDKNVRWKGSETIDNASAALKQRSRDLSATAGQKVIDTIGGNKPGSFRGKIFSSPVDVKIGERVMEDGSVIPIMEKQRQASITAPFDNTVRIGAPLLGAAYLGEKMYPQEKREDTPTLSEISQAATGVPLKKQADVWTDELEKRALFDKQAQLESELMAKTATIDFLREERNQFEKTARFERERASELEKTASELESELIEKTAAHDELFLRVAAEKRSGHAVKVATSLLEKGIIKQAQYRKQIDELMDCDEDTFNIFEKMSQTDNTGEESIETLAFMLEDNNSKGGTKNRKVEPGLSKSGQTFGEAARDLTTT